VGTTANLSVKPPPLRVDYDRPADVLYIAVGRPVPSEGEGVAPGLQLDYALADGSPCGATVIGYNTYGWPGRVDELARLVGAHLQLQPSQVLAALRTIGVSG
jgi:hypothetical protein